MMYKAVLKQEGGCDYTIGCGIRVINIGAETIEEAYSKLRSIIEKDYCHEETELSSAEIYEVKRTMDVGIKDIYAKIEEENKQKARIKQIEKEKADYERLKKIYDTSD